MPKGTRPRRSTDLESVPIFRGQPAGDVRSHAREYTEFALKCLLLVASKGRTESARVAAAAILLDRGWGKAPQSHTGADGDGELKVIIRHIVNGHDVPNMNEVKALPVAPVLEHEGDD